MTLLRSIINATTLTASVVAAGCAGAPTSMAQVLDGASDSWMRPEAKASSSLLYVSNASNVTVYQYNNGQDITLVGTLTGFNSPQGLCTDRRGDVWVSDYGSRTMYEFAHGGTTPIATITVNGGFPFACAVDPTGKLAVSYWYPNAHFYNYAAVVVYPPGSTNGTSYGPPRGFYRSYFLTYDNDGNLFTNGVECGSNDCLRTVMPTCRAVIVSETELGCYNTKTNNPLFELAAGGTQFVQLRGANRQQNISGLVWVNPSFLMGTGKSGTKGVGAVKVQVTGNQAKLVGKVAFSETFLTYGFTVRAGQVIVPDFAGNAVRIYNLSNGSLVSSFTDGLSQPFSTVVSQ
jgi:hypothetical protein